MHTPLTSELEDLSPHSLHASAQLPYTSLTFHNGKARLTLQPSWTSVHHYPFSSLAPNAPPSFVSEQIQLTNKSYRAALSKLCKQAGVVAQR